MSVEEMRRRLVAGLEAELAKGFALKSRTFGCDKKSGCALTAAYIHETNGRVTASLVGEWADNAFGVFPTASFVRGFDADPHVPLDNVAYFDLGQELRQKYLEDR